MIKVYKEFKGTDSFSTPYGTIQCSISGGCLKAEVSPEIAEHLVKWHKFKIDYSVTEVKKSAPKKTVAKKSSPKKSKKVSTSK